jgi:hypothetical protein
MSPAGSQYLLPRTFSRYHTKQNKEGYMKQVMLILVYVILAKVSFAQMTAMPGVGGAGDTVTGAVFPGPVGGTTSVADQSGNVIVFDQMYSYTTPHPVRGTRSEPVRVIYAPKTRVTVITKNGQFLTPREYPAVFQIIGIGRFAVYLAATLYSTDGLIRPVPRQRVIALNFGSLADLPADIAGFPFPADFVFRGPVQLATSSGSLADTLFSVDPPGDPRILTLMPAVAPLVRRFGRFVNFDGINFSATTNRPLP